MGSLFFRKCLAWLAVAFFLLLLPTLGHANIALTGKSFQAILQNETITGYELTKNYNTAYNPYNPGGGSLYSYSGKPVYYDPYKPEVVRSLQAVDDAPLKYPSKVKVKDLIGLKDINGNKVFVVPDASSYTGMTCAKSIAKKALTGLPGIVLSELVFPETLADGTIKASGYQLGKISDSSDDDITSQEMIDRLGEMLGIDTSSSGDIVYPQPTATEGVDLPSYAVGDYVSFGSPYQARNYVISAVGPVDRGGIYAPTLAPYVQISHSSYVVTGFVHTWYAYHTDGRYRRFSQNFTVTSSNPDPQINPFDPSQVPAMSGTEGTFNTLAHLVSNDAEIEMIPIDPALMPTYFPDTDTGFMRFSGHTEIGGEDYLLGPDYTAVLNPPGVTWSGGFPYVDPASIGLIADPSVPGGQTTILPGAITGIPSGSKILSVDPQTGLVKFRTPEGSESSKFLSPEEIQNIQNKVASPYLDANGHPINYGSDYSQTPTNSTGWQDSTVTINANPQDYSVTIPGLPGVPAYPHTFDVPTPDPWPWQDWISNPFTAILDSMEITASGSPYINFNFNFPFYPEFTIQGDFSVYEDSFDTIGAFSVAFAYVMAVLIVVRSRN